MLVIRDYIVRTGEVRQHLRSRPINSNGVQIAVTKIDISPKWPEVKPQGFYVYLHRRVSDGSVFYVGKGKGHRAWRWRGTRSPHWTNVASKNGVIVEIVKDGMSECCSFTLEKIVIGAIGVENLCNFSHGGEGVSGMSGDKHHAYNTDIHSFSHMDGRVFSGTSYEFREENNLSQSLVSQLVNGSRMSHKGWRLSSTKAEDTGMSGCRVWNYDSEVRIFHHIDGREFSGTQRQFINEFDLPQAQVSAMVTGNRVQSTRGWFLDKGLIKGSRRTGKRNHSYDHRVWRFLNVDGLVFTGTQYEFRIKYDLDYRGVSELVNGRIKTHKGWSSKEVTDDTNDT